MHISRKIKVRYSDCDFLGHVNNAVFVDYIIDTIIDVLPDTIRDEFYITSFSIDYQSPIQYPQDIEIDLWFTDLNTAYIKLSTSLGETAAQAKITWKNIESLSHNWMDKIVAVDVPFKLKPFRVKHLDSQGKPFFWDIDIQNRDQTKSKIISPSSIVLWGSEATLVSSSKNGWDFEQMIKMDCAVYVLRHELDILEHPTWTWRDNIEVTSYLHELKTVRGTWRHEFKHSKSGKLLARLYITGAFVNMNGQIISPPDGLTDACLQGEK